MQAQINIAKEKIANGAKFNGTVYGKHNGKNWITFSIYLDSQYFKIVEVQMSTKDETKAAIEKALSEPIVAEPVEAVASEETKTVTATPAKAEVSGKNNWLVNEKPVTNNLDYGQMWEKYGTDFE